MPLLEVGHGHVGRKARSIGVPHGTGEAQEVEVMCAQERCDLRDRQLLLLDMEEKVAALAGSEEVGIFRDIMQRRAFLACGQPGRFLWPLPRKRLGKRRARGVA